MPELSILIPSRNEPWLKPTVEDILRNSRADTEVIVILDGGWPVEPLEQNERVTLVYHPKAVGQRAGTNEAARLSTAKYVMKLDAHCALAEGFDVELLAAAKELGPDVTQIPTQKNLHVFDWVCKGADCGWRGYQGPTQQSCPKCKGSWADFVEREIKWKPRRGVTTYTWRFDNELHFQYWGEYSQREEFKNTDFPETMSCLGACFFMERERYWKLGGMDEAHGSWGQMGTEVGCKSWLSGGRMVTNKRTWFAHLFRTQGGDFSFPYEIHGSDQEKARIYSRKLWRSNGWPGQIRPLSWIVEHFAPVPGWEKTNEQGSVPLSEVRKDIARSEGPGMRDGEESRLQVRTGSKGAVYYSDCRGDETILQAARKQLRRVTNGHRIVGVTLGMLPESHGFDRVIALEKERGYLTMFEQILRGVEEQDADYVFLCEHDVLYDKSHFDFVPPRDDTFYYNLNVWKVDAATGRALHYITRQTSGLCAARPLLLEHYRKRVERVKRDGFSRKMGFEPGSHHRAERVDDHGAEDWRSAVPNVDIRHDKNLTGSRWTKEEFRSQRNCQGWTEGDSVPGWPGQTKGRFAEWLADVVKER